MNTNLNNALKNKNDEFYTQLVDIEKELFFYKEELIGKTIYCCSDELNKSQFIKYFIDNFIDLKINKIIATNYSAKNESFYQNCKRKLLPLGLG